MKECSIDTGYTDRGAKTLIITCRDNEYDFYTQIDALSTERLEYCVFCGAELIDET